MNLDEDLALRLITLKRGQLDEKHASIPGVHFFVSSIQGVTSNKKRKRSSGNRESEEPGQVPGSQTELEVAEDHSAILFNPGVAYFISYTPSDECNDMTIFDMFQKHEGQPEVKLIQTQVRSNAESEDIENLTPDLSMVCKDNNNVVTQDLFGEALAECFRDDKDPLIEELFSRAEAPVNHPTFQNPEFVVNETDFGPRLEKAVQSLRKDGMSLGILRLFCRDPGKVPIAVSHQPKSELFSLIDKIKNAMKTLLYKGPVFAKPKKCQIYICLYASSQEIPRFTAF